MLPVTEDATYALTGTRPGDRLTAEIWYDGTLTTPNLPITRWEITTDAARQVRRWARITINDPDGTLAPWGPDDPLGAGGSILNLTYLLGGLTDTGAVRLGELRITRPTVSESWRSQRLHRDFDTQGRPIITTEPPVWSSTAVVTVEAEDLTRRAELAGFTSPETIGNPGSVIGEVRRLLDGMVPITVHPDIIDAPVPASFTYDRTERLTAVETLLAAIQATHRMNGDGLLEIIPTTPGPPVWDVAGGDDGVLVDFGRAQNVVELPNTAVVEGRTADDRPLVGVARETTGALRVGGPHGQVVADRLHSDLMDTQAKVNAAAATRLANLTAARSVLLPVSCLPHPGLQVFDTVTVTTPAGALTGTVRTIALSGGPDGVDPMRLGVMVPWEQMTTIARQLRRTRKE